VYWLEEHTEQRLHCVAFVLVHRAVRYHPALHPEHGSQRMSLVPAQSAVFLKPSGHTSVQATHTVSAAAEQTRDWNLPAGQDVHHVQRAGLVLVHGEDWYCPLTQEPQG
jgi:hypothetical protein